MTLLKESPALPRSGSINRLGLQFWDHRSSAGILAWEHGSIIFEQFYTWACIVHLRANIFCTCM